MRSWLIASGVAILAALFASRLRVGEDEFDESDVFDSEEDEGQARNWLVPAAHCLMYAVAGILMVVFNLVWNQRNLLYRPEVPGKPRISTGALAEPRFWGLEHQSYFIRSRDGTELHAWLLHSDASQSAARERAAVLFLHSNAGDVAQRLDFFKRLCTKLDLVVLALEYRGFGRSQDGGGFSEAAFVEDAAAAWRWLLSYASSDKSLVDPSRIYVFGRSLGGCVTVRLVAHLLGAHPTSSSPGGGEVDAAPLLPLPAGILLENAPSSIADVARHILPPLRCVPRSVLARPLLRDEWRSSEWLGWIGKQLASRPSAGALRVCLLSGKKDQVVPPQCMASLRSVAEELGASAFAGVDFHSFQNGEHMNTYLVAGDAYWDALRKFIN